MTANVLQFPSRRLLRQSGPRGFQCSAPQRHGVEIVRLDCAIGDDVDAFEEFGTGATTATLPTVPNLPHCPHSGSGSIQSEPLVLSPHRQRVFSCRYSHNDPSKPIAYSLTRACKGFTCSIVSADVLHFGRMDEAPNRIRELRNAAEISQEVLGDRIGVHKMTISDLERGNVELTLNYMRRIASALGVPISDLLTPADNPDRITGDEAELLRAFRNSAPDAQQFLIASARAVSTQETGRAAA